MKNLCKIEFKNEKEYELVVDTYVSFFRDNTYFIVIDDQTKTWESLVPEQMVSKEVGHRIDGIVAAYFRALSASDKVRSHNNEEFEQLHKAEMANRVQPEPMENQNTAPSTRTGDFRPLSYKTPWYSHLQEYFYLGALSVFAVIGIVTFTVVSLGWLLKLIHACF